MACTITGNLINNATCSYILNGGINRAWIIDINDITLIEFQGDKRPEIGLINRMTYPTKSQIEINADIENTKFSQKISDNNFSFQFETVVGVVDYITETNLQKALNQKFVVIFKTTEQKYFCFGLDSGASFSYSLDISNGYQITLTQSDSDYPLFQVANTVIRSVNSEEKYDLFV
jgi:hypothetical protein